MQAQLEAVYTEAEADARFEQLTRKGAADGYAPLDAGGLVPTAHLPPLAVTDTYVVASEAAMLALAAQVGDICIRSDLGETYILAVAPASVLANWLEMAAAGQVVSVNGETGVVSLSAADVGAAAADHTHPSEESGQWRFQNNPAMADPGDGYLRSNTGVLATATVLAISRTTQDGYDIPPARVRAGRRATPSTSRTGTTARRWVRYTADEPLARFATYATGAVTVTGVGGEHRPRHDRARSTFSLAGGGGGGGAPGDGVRHATPRSTAALSRPTPRCPTPTTPGATTTPPRTAPGSSPTRSTTATPSTPTWAPTPPPRPPTASGSTPRTTAAGWPPSTTSPRAGRSTSCPP